MQAGLINQENHHRPNAESFEIVYKQAKYIKSGEIDAESFAISLIGFCNYQKLITKEFLKTDLQINIKNFRAGSFETVVDFLSQREVVATGVAATLLQFFGLDARTILKLPIMFLKWISKKLIDKYGDYDAIIKEIDESQLDSETKNTIRDIIVNKKAKIHLDDMTSALDKEEINEIQVRANEIEYVSIKKKTENISHFLKMKMRKSYLLMNTLQIFTLSITHHIGYAGDFLILAVRELHGSFGQRFLFLNL